MIEKSLLENQIEEHFKSLFNQYYIFHDNGLIEETTYSLVNYQTNAIVTNIPSFEEIHQVVMNLSGDSSPSPYSFRLFFYQH